MSASHLRGEDAAPEELPPEEIMQQIEQLLPAEGGMPSLASMIRDRAQKKASKRRKNNLAPPPYTVQVQVSRRNPLRVQAQNELFIQAYTMAAQAGQQFPLKMLFELLMVDGKDRIMPVLEQVDQQTQMLQMLVEENQMLKESNANMQGTLNEYNQKMLAGQAQAAPQMSAQALGVGGNEAALVGGPRR